MLLFGHLFCTGVVMSENRELGKYHDNGHRPLVGIGKTIPMWHI